jgi:hypothetical protein
MLRNRKLFNFRMDFRCEKLTEPNTMSSSRYFFAVLAMCTPAALFAATHHRYACPSALIDGKVKRSLSHIEVFAGPPKNMASLEPAITAEGDVLEGLEGADAYLVCGYEGTDKIITIHAPDATVCKAPIHPDVVFCD